MKKPLRQFIVRTFGLLSLLSLAPFALAQTATQTSHPIDKLSAFLNQFIVLIDNVLVPLIFAMAFIVFLYGIFQYFILGGANEEKRDTGKQLMLYGFIGFFIMVSVWGIVNLLVGSFGLSSQSRPQLPTFNGTGGGSGGAPTAGGLPTAESQGCRAPGAPACPTGTGCNNDGVCDAAFTSNPTQITDLCKDTKCQTGYMCSPLTGACVVQNGPTDLCKDSACTGKDSCNPNTGGCQLRGTF